MLESASGFLLHHRSGLARQASGIHNGQHVIISSCSRFRLIKKYQSKSSGMDKRSRSMTDGTTVHLKSELKRSGH
jgi:hypothetical protein